jgi:catechol 2,3-dioxygenase-like lactoylglutathione lyase family enzyme
MHYSDCAKTIWLSMQGAVQPVMMTKFHHVHIICDDLNQMVGFFVNSLNASLIELKQFDGVDGAKLDLGGTTISLRLPLPDDQIRKENCICRGYDHIGVQVDDIEKAYAELKGKGFVFDGKPIQTGNIIKAFFRGPENLSIELLQVME